MKMKLSPLFFALALLSLTGLAPRASAQATLQTFCDDLAPYGRWTRLGGYGDVWRPRIDDPAWTPYSEGHWVYTDYGWTWISDEPWGWITYHYGRWLDSSEGWYWIPGTAWAPAWVEWRFGGGYCGWVPLPPRGGRIPFQAYRFVRTGFLGAASLRGVYLDRAQNARYFHAATSIGVVASGSSRLGLHRLGGPPLAAVNAASAHPIHPLHLQVGAAASPGAAVVGNTLQISAPRVTRVPFHPAVSAPAPPAVHPAAPAPSQASSLGSLHPGGTGGAAAHPRADGHPGGGGHHEGGFHPSGNGGGGEGHPAGGFHPAGAGPPRGGGHPGDGHPGEGGDHPKP